MKYFTPMLQKSRTPLEDPVIWEIRGGKGEAVVLYRESRPRRDILDFPDMLGRS